MGTLVRKHKRVKALKSKPDSVVRGSLNSYKMQYLVVALALASIYDTKVLACRIPRSIISEKINLRTTVLLCRYAEMPLRSRCIYM